MINTNLCSLYTSIITMMSYCRLHVRIYQNQNTKELISPRKMSHKHNNKDLSRLRQLSPGMRVQTQYINATRGTSRGRSPVKMRNHSKFMLLSWSHVQSCVYIKLHTMELEGCPVKWYCQDVTSNYSLKVAYVGCLTLFITLITNAYNIPF